MWRTNIGDRALRGAEWGLFRQGLWLLWDHIEDAGDEPELCRTGVAVFDRLQPSSKLAMIALVGKALSSENEPCPALTALAEGTFAAVYAVIGQEIEIEIDMGREGPQTEGEEFSMRPLVLEAVRETNPDGRIRLRNQNAKTGTQNRRHCRNQRARILTRGKIFSRS